MIDKSKSILSSLNPRRSLSSLGLDETRIANLLNGFKSLMYIYLSMIPTLTFRLWVIWAQQIRRKTEPCLYQT